MPRSSKPGYYAVRIGRIPGIYLSWPECEDQVKGFAGAVFKKFPTEADAIDFLAVKPSVARSRENATTSRAILVPEPNLNEEDYDAVYCDGACKGNGQPGAVAGIGVWWGHGDPRNISERCPGSQTNNRAELIAIVRILETTPYLWRKLLIKTDSKYAFQCVTSWVFNWMNNGFLTADEEPVKNRAIIKYLAALLHARHKTSQTIEFKPVRGHAGIQGNEAADQLANLGATKPAVPERDWKTLETQVSEDLFRVVDDDLRMTYGMTSSLGTSIANPVQEQSRSHLGNRENVAQNHTLVSTAPRDISSPQADAVPVTVSTLHDETSIARSRHDLSSRDSSRPSAVMVQGLQSVPSKKLTTAVGKDELEVFASCLLGDDELSSLEKDGAFDSDF